MTLPELAEALDSIEAKVAVAKAFAHAVIIDPRIDVELRWAMLPDEIRLGYIARVEHVIEVLRVWAPASSDTSKPPTRKGSGRT